ncbi:AAA family ATPase [Jatrophihabitans sp. DSM 45814]
MDVLSSVTAVHAGLGSTGYLADETTASVTYLAERLRKPLLVEGPAGTGKTELAKSFAAMTGRRLIRLQCYEGLDESKILYEWNYKKQLLRIQAQSVISDDRPRDWHDLEGDIFTDEFLLSRPVLESLRAAEPVVLLIDEIDRVEIETEAMLLEVLSEFQLSVPEMGTVTAKHIPAVFLTSNDTRELSEALKRRCLYLHLDYPSAEREREIIQRRVPELSDVLARQIAEFVGLLRTLDLKKNPSISETLDWARSLALLGGDGLERADFRASLNILLKHNSDFTVALTALDKVLR